MASLFISYSRKDINFARKLTEAFSSQDLDFWIDWEGIPPTVDWWQEIEKGIEEADIFLFLLSPDSSISTVCKQEIEYATKNGKRLIPIVVQDMSGVEAPSELNHLNWIFLRESDDFEMGFTRLITAIKTDYEWVQIHRRLQVRALEWDRGNKDNSFLLRGKDLQEAETQMVTNAGKEPKTPSLQTEYVLKSRQASNRQRRLTAGLAITGLIALAALAIFGFVQAELATEQANAAQTAQANAENEANQRSTAQAIAEENQKVAEDRARIARARELAAQSITLQDRNFQNALLLGVEAFQLVDNVQTRGAMLDNIRSNPQLLQIISGHSGSVNSVAFSPDGKILASGSDDHTIILWDISTGQLIGQPLKGHSDLVTSVAFSPDGKTLVSGGKESKIIIWDVTTGNSIDKPLIGHSEGITSVAYSPDGMFIVSGGNDGKIILWDAITRQPIGGPLTNQSDWVWKLAISSDGKTVASASDNVDTILSPVLPPAVTLWDITTRQFTKQTLIQLDQSIDFGINNYGKVYSVTFSPDGKTLAAGTFFGTIFLWDLPTSQLLSQPLFGHTDKASVAFSPDGKTFASASEDSTIIVWAVTTGEPIGKLFKGHSGAVNSIDFSPDGKLLASGGDDGSIIIWDVSNAFNTNVTNSYPIGESLPSIFSSNFSLAFSPDGKTLASGNIFSISFWDITISSPYRRPPAGDINLGEVHSVAFSPDGKFLASADSKKVILWDATTRVPIREPFENHSETVNSVAFSPNSEILATASEDGTLILLNVKTHQAIGEPVSGNSGSLNSLAFSPDGNTLAAGSSYNSIVIWDVSNPILPKKVNNYAKRNSATGHSGPVNSVAFSPDGKILASGSDDKTIILWDVLSGQPIRQPITGHLEKITGVAFSPDGKTLASVSFDKTVILWDVETRRPIGQPIRGSQELILGVAFSPDGKMLASGGRSKTVMIWDLDPQSWIDTACQRAGRNFTQDEWNQYFPDEEYGKTCSQWPIDFGNFRQILEETIVNLNEPQQVQVALDKVRDAMEIDSTSVIEDPASAASQVVTEWIAAELLNKVNNNNWEQTLDLLDQLNTTYANLPINLSFIEQKVAREVAGEILGQAKAGDWKESLDMLEHISASFEHLPIDFSLLNQSIENMVRNEIPKEVDSGNWQNVLKLLDLVYDKGIVLDDANLLNSVCWEGSLNGYASDVLEHCERAVELDPDDENIRDSRGLARALTGDFDGAIKDFQDYVDIRIRGENVEKRVQWIIELEAGRNPFTEEILNDLR